MVKPMLLLLPSRTFLSAALPLRYSPTSGINIISRALSSSPSSSSSSSSAQCHTYTTAAVRGGAQQQWQRSWQARSGSWTAQNLSPWNVAQRRMYKTVGEQRSRYKSGPFSWKAGVLFLSSGIGLIFYFRYEKERMERQRIAEATKGVGKPKVGGPFELLDQTGKPFSSEDMKGRYSLVYFGFTHCPDICPEELDKMARIIDLVNGATQPASSKTASLSSPQSTSTIRPLPTSNMTLPPILPLFITCDPARDTPSVLAAYLSEFHPSIVGLTGTWEQMKAVCKSYRVYFSTPEGVKPGQDYLVDHSIYFYLMDPDGDFVEAIGRQHSPEQAAGVILGHWGDWVRGRGREG